MINACPTLNVLNQNLSAMKESVALAQNVTTVMMVSTTLADLVGLDIQLRRKARVQYRIQLLHAQRMLTVMEHYHSAMKDSVIGALNVIIVMMESTTHADLVELDIRLERMVHVHCRKI